MMPNLHPCRTYFHDAIALQFQSLQMYFECIGEVFQNDLTTSMEKDCYNLIVIPSIHF
jgi:hypothetical protein